MPQRIKERNVPEMERGKHIPRKLPSEVRGEIRDVGEVWRFLAFAGFGLGTGSPKKHSGGKIASSISYDVGQHAWTEIYG